jgi:hypothetical protein
VVSVGTPKNNTTNTMSEILVSKVILQKIRDHIIETQTAEVAQIAAMIGCEVDDEKTLDAYQDALRQFYPEDFPDPDEVEPVAEEEEEEETPAPAPAPAPKSKTAPAPVPSQDFKLLDNGFLRDLEVVKTKGGLTIVQIVAPPAPELVSIVVRGSQHTVDLTVLRKLDPDSVDPTIGVKVSALIALAELAKA